jgi:hypothetical protein
VTASDGAASAAAPSASSATGDLMDLSTPAAPGGARPGPKPAGVRPAGSSVGHASAQGFRFLNLRV